jgi:hypothetical protein
MRRRRGRRDAHRSGSWTRGERGESRWRWSVKRRRRSRSARRDDWRLSRDIWLRRRLAYSSGLRLWSLDRDRGDCERFGCGRRGRRRRRFAGGCDRGAHRRSRRLRRGFRRNRRGGSRRVWRGDHGQRLAARNDGRDWRSNRRRWRYRNRQRLAARRHWRVGRNNGGRRGRQRLAARNNRSGGPSSGGRRGRQRLATRNDRSNRLRSGRWRHSVALALWPYGREGGGGRSGCGRRDRKGRGRLASGGSRGGRGRSACRVRRGAGRLRRWRAALSWTSRPTTRLARPPDRP